MTSARLALLVLLLVTVFGVLAPSALARTTRVYESSFGSLPGGEIEAGPGQMTVDQSNGDIYVFSNSTGAGGTVSRFAQSGAPKNFTAGPDAGTNILTGFSGSGAVAVNHSGGALNGYIFVADELSALVKVFTNDGAVAGTLDGSGTSEGLFNWQFNAPCGVAVDQSNGDVYIAHSRGANGSGKIWRYAPASPAAPINDADFTVTGTSAAQVCDVAANSGNVYAADRNINQTNQPGLFKFSPSSFVVNPPGGNSGTPIASSPVTAVYVDPKNGDVYANRGDHVSVFDSTDEFLYDFGYAGIFGRDSSGVAAVSAASGAAVKAYVADQHGKSDQIDVFGAVTNVPSATHPTIAAFGSDGTSNTSFNPGLGQLALEQDSRRLFALDTVAPGIYGFDGAGPPAFPTLGGFSPLGTAAPGFAPDLTVDTTGLPSAGNVYFVSSNTNLLYGFDSTGTPLGGAFPVDPATDPGAPAGSPKNLCGVAVDSSGHVWVSNSSRKRILEYSATGGSLAGTIDTSAQDTTPEGNSCELAFDSADNLYLDVGRAIWRYTAASGYASATQIDSSGSTGLAVDRSNDHLYVAHSDRVDEYDPAGSFVDEFATGIPNANFRGVAIDATNHYLYLADAGNRKIRVLGPGVFLPEVKVDATSGATNTTATLNGRIGPQGISLTDCHFEYVSDSAFRASGFDSAASAPCVPAFGAIPADFATHSVSAAATGLAASTIYHVRLVAANATANQTGDGGEFTTPGPAVVETVGAPIRTMTSAQLGGRVLPRNAATTYFFEYGEQGPCDANPCTQTEPKSAGSGDFTLLASEEIQDLQPNTTYHYRLVADNGNPDGADVGEDMTVTTRGLEAPLSHGRFPGPSGSDRAWELVSLAESGGNPVDGATVMSDDGSRVVWGLGGGSPTTDTGGFTLLYSERTPAGWQTKRTFPPRSELVGPNWSGPLGRSDLSTFTAVNYTISGEYALFLMRPGEAAVRLHGVPKETQYGFFTLTADDGSRVLMGTINDNADPDHPVAPGTTNLFEVTTPGEPRLVGYLPGEVVPACGIVNGTPGTTSPYGFAGIPPNTDDHWISSDGKLAFFMSKGNDCASQPQVYMRDFEVEETKLISGPPVSGPECGAGMIKSTAEAAFFWSKARLVAEDTVPSECSNDATDGDIYRYDLSNGSLSCVTCVVPNTDADVLVGGTAPKAMIAFAKDGSRAYFTSGSRLVPGAKTPGVYRLDVENGDLAYVGSLADARDFGKAVLSADGSLLFFRSSEAGLNPLGGGAGNAGTAQLYRYDDRDRSLICVSCPQDGSAPRAAVVAPTLGDSHNTKPLSSQGIFAFSTPTPLVSADQNTAAAGQDPGRGTDAYEWRDGRLLLVSDGLSDWVGGETVPTVRGISPSGRDLLFTAATQYTADAVDDFRRLYDARIGGGFEFPAPPPPCPLEVCQGTPKGVPEEAAPGTGFFAGPGNAREAPRPRCAKGKARRRGRCVTKKPRRAKQHHRRANHDRRTAR